MNEENKNNSKVSSVALLFLVLIVIVFMAFISKMIIPQVREVGKDKNMIMEREIRVSSTGNTFDYERADENLKVFSDIEILLDRIETQIEVLKNPKIKKENKPTDMSLQNLYEMKMMLTKLKQDTLYSDSVNWQHEQSLGRILASMLNYIQDSYKTDDIPFDVIPKYKLIVDREEISGAGTYDSFNFEYEINTEGDDISTIKAERKPAKTKYFFLLDIPNNEKKCFVYDDKYVEFCKYIL
ncbi:MAG: hypothetical protein HN833_05210 [Elusimicrobiaceae bacterium]|mgnify:FL=1|jgi:hypothetical protein|nr:hypothetical protein [Elusimicrobiaceae bacterium]MBT4008659.1 hypothetical protein [Elusimicrobiaceae bacterium]MBT4403045.1 hypothetical protein [Elusimicrobiaceae bacterium]MBT6715598.1 hypothetical protein [Elusimicrobiaceae bacterium]MBT7283777.1 hypothetical protein [Elusimicrobiaceae bacterium]